MIKIKMMVIGAALISAAVSANAIPIDLGQTTGSPASLSTDLSRLNGQISIYNIANDPDLQAATLVGATGPTLGTGTSIVLDVTGWTYLCVKWADTDQFYFVGNDSGSLTFNSTVFNGNDKPQGLSGYDFFDPKAVSVPDGGSTAMMLGAALSGLGLMGRRFKIKLV